MSNSSETYKPKLLVISSRFPFPLEKGDKLRLYYQLKELSENHHITLITLSEQKIHEAQLAELKPFCQHIHVFQISAFSKYINTAFQLFTDRPFQVGYFYNYFIKQKIKKIIQHTKPDHIYCQLIRVAAYVKDYHQCPKTIDYMDALSLGMMRRAEKSTGLMKRLLSIEGQRLEQYERKIFDYFENHSIITTQDKNAIQHANKAAIKVIPNGVSPKFFEPIKAEKKYDIVFTGNMNYPPNIEACLFIATELMPQLSPETHVLISGASPARKVQQLQSKNIHVSGWVEDIRLSYAQGKVFVAPMFIGTGLQNKLLEAMAMGIPAITTTLANNALAAKPNSEILIAETPEEFKSHYESLITDSRLYQTISENGKSFVQNYYSWPKTTHKLSALFNKSE